MYWTRYVYIHLIKIFFTYFPYHKQFSVRIVKMLSKTWTQVRENSLEIFIKILNLLLNENEATFCCWPSIKDWQILPNPDGASRERSKISLLMRERGKTSGKFRATENYRQQHVVKTVLPYLSI